MSRLPSPDDTSWLIKTLFAWKERTIPAAILMSIGFVANGTTPVVVGHAIDQAVATSSLGNLGWWMAALAATFAVNAACGWFSRNLFNRVRVELAHEVRMAVTDRIQDPRGMAGNQRTAGDLLAIASTDVQRVAFAVMMTVFPAAEVSSIIYVAVMIALVNVPLGIAVFIGGPLVVVLSLRAAKPLRGKSTTRQAALAKASATATDVVHGLRIVKGLGAIDTVRARYELDSDTAYQKTIEANAAQARLNAVTEAIGAMYVGAVGLAAGAVALAGAMSIGDLITVVGLTQFVITPMTMMGKNIAGAWANAQASSERIRSVLNADFAEHPDAQLPALPMGITTVAGHAPEGIEFLDRQVAIVAPHQADLFAGSILDNISPDRERALAALRVAAGEDIPGGPDREVGENGGNLSGGQRQRVALARAIATDADVLVLQDPTTAVDSVTEQTIVQRVAAHRKGKRTLVYTTAPAWVAAARGGMSAGVS